MSRLPVVNLRTFDTLFRAERIADQPLALLSRIVGWSSRGGGEAVRVHFCALRSADLRDCILGSRLDLLARAEEAFRLGQPVLLVGRFVPRQAEPPALHVVDIQPVRGASALMCPRPEELTAARARLAELRQASVHNPDALLEHVLREAQALVGLRAAASRRYRQMQVALLLQCLSGTQDGPLPGQGGGPGDLTAGRRLALLTLGRSGRGKKTLAQLAQLLSPLSVKMQGSSVDAGTLRGLAHRSAEGGLMIEPGLLMQADGGVAIIEEFHALRRHREPVHRALCEALDQGLVQPLGASEAVCEPLRCGAAIYLDMNLDAVLNGVVPGRTSQRLLDCPEFGTDLLSHMDVVACVDAGNDDESSARSELWSDSERPPARPVEEDGVQRQRDLQLLLCQVRDEIRQVRLDPVAEDLVSGFFDRSVGLTAGRGVDAAAFVRRGSLSLRRLCTAAARMRLRDIAAPEDAHLALDLFSLKVETLAWLWQRRL
ncbi:MAG: hypothetical protein RMK29_12600 [Myxococcales bacterium]|nr:hypothetical protein [Myxococcota bacterium]MDW8282544.1 hypothetical protein [Myxococcales bacterium]